jgi:hypothetical protein
MSGRPAMKTTIRLFIVLFISLITYHLSLITTFAAAAPNPQPCKNPANTDLVSNYIVDKNGKPPPLLILQYKVSGKKGETKDNWLEARQFSYQVDFSQLQAIFGASNSNYLEGNFQDKTHNQQNVTGLDAVGFNQYNHSLQKITPSALTNQQRTNYVNYIVGDGHTLPESANTYTDINGQGDPKTIYDLVQSFGPPNPPTASNSQQDQDSFNETWGKYWPKIPTAWSQFYKAKITFHQVDGDTNLKKVKNAEFCPLPLPDYVNFVMPDFYRTTAIGDQMNRSMVALAVQSYQQHHILNPTPTPAPGTTQTQNPLSDFFSYCWKLLTSPASIAKDIKKAVSTNLPNPLNPSSVFAANGFSTESCIKFFPEAKSGQAPYCPLPQDEKARLGPAVSCNDKNDTNKLEKNNQNVFCTFTFKSQPADYTIDPDEEDVATKEKVCPDKEHDTKTGIYTCYPKVYILPNFQIPWLSAIWNDTLSSSQDTSTPFQNQSGKPGVYTFFTPKSVYTSLFPSEDNTALNLLKKCYPNWPDETGGDKSSCDQLNAIGNVIPCRIDVTIEELAECVSGKISSKLPGSAGTQATDPKQQFIGATDCAKHFVDAVSLKPIALQQSLGIQQDCTLTASAGNSSGGGENPPADHPGSNNDCSGKYGPPPGLYPTKYFSETGNFGDPNCDYSESQLLTILKTLDPDNANYWFYTVVNCESRYNPNAFRHHIEPGADNTPDPAGAWGLFQMGRGKNGPYDHGDVPWHEQIQNAVKYKNDVNGGSFSYWGCAT